MEQRLSHAPLNGSALVRRLAEMGVAPAAGRVAPPFVDGLGRWLGWADAIPLAAALQAGAPARGAAVDVDAEARALEQARRALLRDLAPPVPTPAPVRGRPGAELPVDDETDIAVHRERYLDHQRAMELRLAPLRARLRAALARRCPALARIAALDAVLDGVIGARERSLLGALPGVLERRFAELRAEAGAAPASDSAATSPAPAEWLARFRHEMHGLLQAELELRLLPLQGLLDALRDAPTETA